MGRALHRGGPAAVALLREPGPLRITQRGKSARLDELVPIRTDRGVTVATIDRRLRVDLIEHLLAAMGGVGVRSGVVVEVEDELPLLDGGSKQYVDALLALGLPSPSPPELYVTRSAVFEHGHATYRFEPSARTLLRVAVDFPAPVFEGRAEWHGDAEDFANRIAVARTFGWTSEQETLREAGRAAEVDLASVVVFDDRGPLPGCELRGADEPVRHKLLDLIGDLTLHGGPPRGVVEAHRPGHTGTHAVVMRALREGVLSRERLP